MIAAWRRYEVPAGLPELSVADAVTAAAITDRALAVLSVRLRNVDVVHASSNGTAALVGLAHHWRTGDIVIADNHALLHGRRAFKQDAKRHLRRVNIL